MFDGVIQPRSSADPTEPPKAPLLGFAAAVSVCASGSAAEPGAMLASVVSVAPAGVAAAASGVVSVAAGVLSVAAAVVSVAAAVVSVAAGVVSVAADAVSLATSSVVELGTLSTAPLLASAALAKKKWKYH